MAVAVDRSARRGVFIFHNMPEERKSHGSLRFKYMYTANDEAGSSWIADRKKKTKLRIRGFFIAVVFFFRLSGPTFRKVISEMTQKGFSTSVKTEEFSALLLNIFKGFANISIPFLNFFLGNCNFVYHKRNIFGHLSYHFTYLDSFITVCGFHLSCCCFSVFLSPSLFLPLHQLRPARRQHSVVWSIFYTFIHI